MTKEPMCEYITKHKNDMKNICGDCSEFGSVEDSPYCGYHQLHMTWILPTLIKRMSCINYHENMSG